MFQQGCVALIGQDEGGSRTCSQGSNLKTKAVSNEVYSGAMSQNHLNKTSTTCEESKNKTAALENQFFVHHVS